MWDDDSAPYRKVGHVLWKDLKMIQKEMTQLEKTNVLNLLKADTEWTPGWLNDEVGKCWTI